MRHVSLLYSGEAAVYVGAAQWVYDNISKAHQEVENEIRKWLGLKVPSPFKYGIRGAGPKTPVTANLAKDTPFLEKELQGAFANVMAHATDADNTKAIDNALFVALHQIKRTRADTAANRDWLTKKIKATYTTGVESNIFKTFANTVGKGIEGVAQGAVSIGKGTISFAKGAINVTGKLVTSPLKLASDIATGKNVFQSLKDTVKRDLSTVKEAGPYALTVMSVIPGIGTGVTAAVTAGLALANGQRIDDALIAGMKGAIPGGALAQQGFGVGVDLLKGKNVSDAVLNTARSQLPAGAQAAFDAGVAVAKGRNVQDMVSNIALDKAGAILNVAKDRAIGTVTGIVTSSPVWKIAKENVIPGVQGAYSKGVIAAQAVGKVATLKDTIIKEARKNLPGGMLAQMGFDTAMGIITDGKGFTDKDIVAVRAQLPATAKAAFDTAFTMHAGRIQGKPAPATLPAKSQAAFYVARGAVKTKAPLAMKKAVVKMAAPTSAERDGIKAAIVDLTSPEGAAPVSTAIEPAEISWLEWFWQELKHLTTGSQISIKGDCYG